MIRFECDYNEGAHPFVLDALTSTNYAQTIGYGEDEYCEDARARIKDICHSPSAAVHFFVGGTQTNATVISSLLKPYEGIVAADSGHIAVHETGAVEAYGHKVITLPASDGKIDAESVKALFDSHHQSPAHEHMVKPGAVYISHPTETGTLYSKDELSRLYSVCKKLGLYIYIDGARFGYALGSDANDVRFEDMKELCDLFYIGGTKCGLLFGEALVIFNDSLKKEFRYYIKQHGAMLAKGRLLGIQFSAILNDGLYERICRKAVSLAMKIKSALLSLGVEFTNNSYTNQLFPIFDNDTLAKLSLKYSFDLGDTVDSDHTSVRICTSWATSEEAVNALIENITNCLKEKEI